MEHKEIHVTGRVQGVYYRASAKQMAMHLGIKGYVKNEMDGSVRLAIEGDGFQVQEMINWCKKGPMLARVSDIQISFKSPENYLSFDIKK